MLGKRRVVSISPDELERVLIENAFAVHVFNDLLGRFALAETRNIVTLRGFKISLLNRGGECFGGDGYGQFRAVFLQFLYGCHLLLHFFGIYSQ